MRVNKGALGVVVGFVAGLAIGFVVSLQAGPLTPPPTAVSGGAPVSTMRTLDQIPPTWDRMLLTTDNTDLCNTSRFTCVMRNNSAVRDNETGLVWDRSPAATTRGWELAHFHCYDRKVGPDIPGDPQTGRQGWRLPAIQELASLVNRNSPFFPPSHPFVIETQSDYWSATPDPGLSNQAFAVFLALGGVASRAKNTPARVLCVRGT